VIEALSLLRSRTRTMRSQRPPPSFKLRAHPSASLCTRPELRRLLNCTPQNPGAAWDVGVPTLSTCKLYDGAWNYRLGDITGSRFFRHSTGGMHFHRQTYPDSLAVRFLNEYGHGTRAYNKYYNSSCRLSCSRTGYCQCYVPRVLALHDLLSRERARNNSGYSFHVRRQLARTAAVHLRLGDVVEQSPFSIDEMLSRQTVFSARCDASVRETGCLGFNRVAYVQPLSNYRSVVARLRELNIQAVAIVAASHLEQSSLTKSCKYVERMGIFFKDLGFNVTFRVGRHPDDDFRFFSGVACMVSSQSGFAALAARVAEGFGVQIVSPAVPATDQQP
jgi:hypothetical protein